MAFLTPTIAYLHSIFEGPTPTTPADENLRLGRARRSENDPFAAAFEAANESKPSAEDEKVTDPFTLFCDIPGTPSDARMFELSPPDSDHFEFTFDRDNTISHISHPQPSEVVPSFNQQTQTIQAKSLQLEASQPQQKGFLLPPTPPFTTYESPYAKPSPENANIPTQLKQRRRGPKPKNTSGRTEEEKEEIRMKFLERNKHAAKRCRERKKLGVEATLKLLREQEDAVLQLQAEKDVLEEEVKRLKDELEGCSCGHMKGAGRSDQTENNGLEDDEMKDWLVSSPKSECEGSRHES